MQKFKFNTNINCGGCVASIQDTLDQSDLIQSWKVETGHQDKILEVESKSANPEEIIAIVEEAGFKAELRKKGWIASLLK